jgi:hypothetical protein
VVRDKLSPQVFHVKPMAIPCLRKIGKTTCAITLLLLVFFLGPSSLGAQSKSLSSHKRAQVEKAASSFMATNSVPGISVAVVRTERWSGPKASEWPTSRILFRRHL